MDDSSFPDIDAAYRILTGSEPPAKLLVRDRIVVVMEHWDGRLFDGDPAREKVARRALASIGHAWFSPGVPYPLALIGERLREMMPELGDAPVTRAIFQSIIADQS